MSAQPVLRPRAENAKRFELVNERFGLFPSTEDKAAAGRRKPAEFAVQLLGA
jgi:hypothetical protein